MSPFSLEQIAELIVNVPNFPKPGIQFKDITPILENAGAFQSLSRLMCESVFPGTTHLVAIESRGFILASAMAQHLKVGVVLARKPNKLPRETLFVNYDLEYGTDRLEVHKSSLNSLHRVTIVDDVLATGGTAQAAEKLVQLTGANVLGSCFFMELISLMGIKKLRFPAKSLLQV